MDPYDASTRSTPSGRPSVADTKAGTAIARGIAVFLAGVALALWIVFGRFLFGVGGELTPIYLLIGIVIVFLYAFIGQAMARAATRGYLTRRATLVTLIAAWGCGILLGLTIPDVTPDGLQTVISGTAEPWRGIAIGLANPAGIITVALSIAALVLANQDARGPRPSDDETP
ncbi:hypothetical protein [Diaminobutyricimonas sp. LJ205]|uniref:hypothetical protein n=1 Tax=Diaminobutyricimonas sp. LJ205 TaxID=2683590 RepID=UPI0018E05CB2|nr:hypothetical protein [Diaminobutyricimonas sp. LJ205]